MLTTCLSKFTSQPVSPTRSCQGGQANAYEEKSTVGSYKPHMQEFPPELIGRDKAVPRVVVDSRSACLAEAGEIIASGIAAEDLIELGTLVDKDGKPGDSLSTLTGARQTLFKSVGVGAMDVAIAHTVHELARALQVGQDLIFE